MKITLIRHGPPIIPSQTRISNAEFPAWISKFNAGGLEPNHPPSQELIKLTQETNFIISSTYTRAIQSAHQIFNRPPDLTCELFREAEMPSGLPLRINAKASHFLILYRTLWLLGIHPSAESRSKYNLRVQNAAKILIAHTKEHNNIALIAHGLINRSIAQNLKRNHWQITQKSNHSYWSYTILTRPPQ